MESHLQFVEPPPALTGELMDATNRDFRSFERLFRDFLKGKGVPLPQEFEAVKGGFADSVDLSKIGEEEFRPKMLAYAATGSPLINEQTGIMVHFCFGHLSHSIAE